MFKCLLILLHLSWLDLATGFIHPAVVQTFSSVGSHQTSSHGLAAHQQPQEHRRDVLGRLVLQSTMGVFLSTLMIPPVTRAHAADGQQQQLTLFNTGKAPIVPGQAPKDKSDTKGTKRDPNFLRAISDCKAQCEQSNGPDGFARSKEECLELCQDVCCKTYEQCTFAITPR